MFSSPLSKCNPKITTLDAAAERENLNRISKFGLPASIAQHIDLCLIFHNVHIDNLSILSNIKLNSWVLNGLECYQIHPTLVVYMMLEVFRDEFQG